MKLTLPTLLTSAALGILFIAVAYVAFGNALLARADAGTIPATIATSSNPVVSTTPSLIFATSTCADRIVSTNSVAVNMTFSDIAGAPTATFGTYQPASTTVTYDNSRYGCGPVRAYGFGTGSLTATESR